MFTDTLGDWLELQRRRAKFWLNLLFIALLILVLVNVFVRPAPQGEEIHPAGHIKQSSELERQAHGPLEVEPLQQQEAEHHEGAAMEGHGEEAHGEAAGAHGGHGNAPMGFFDVDAPHFEIDGWPGFWPLFGFICATAMILVLKKIVAKVLGRREDFYAD